ncbi:nitrite reductase large subunit NirB [Leptonema illini]|uniref:Nitrite reductase (NAD(P)H), large subunit n=1 Tax=Leptonema illini DSM 21528 TaxID=929563 RepID=H2CKR6_9LEPT|nr:nitrite reductase large subunit NirB [Leptonema illini]EHQ06150.1 nitrite reductase (NAD(P)H), large subunit [Leptonema illini DSM 21528]
MAQNIVIIGNGMIAHRLLERLSEAGSDLRLTVIGEEGRSYDRVHLTDYFENRSAESLYLCAPEWYHANNITLIPGRAVAIDRDAKTVALQNGETVCYDRLVLATGSSAFIPPFQGNDRPDVFVYRTIEDVERIYERCSSARTAAVIGGGLLGLEAAKAVHGLKVETHVIEFAERLMPRQLDADGAALLKEKIEELGIKIHLGKQTTHVTGDVGHLMHFSDGTQLAVDMIVISAGIRPRDELARACGLDVASRGGVVVNEFMQTSDAAIYAIGEAASYNGMVYGLVAPGYDMAEVAASRILESGSAAFAGADMSTKLKLIGVDVASFGDALGEQPHVPIVFRNPRKGTYKKLLISKDGRLLLGGVLVGDTSAYGTLLALYQNAIELPEDPESLIATSSGASEIALPDTAKICSCNNVSRGQIKQAINEGCTTIEGLKKSCNAGTGCGGCLPQVNMLLKEELKRNGTTVRDVLCEHFPHSRQELFQIIKVRGLKSFSETIASVGQGHGCEICKPAIASIFASLYNEPILRHREIQDTNDRYLATIQKGGSYSVIPRIPGGEITPRNLIILGQIAEKYGLYCKITGGQRIDMLGARLDDLPLIWQELVEAGFESGHAYGKALRTVKSCVGSTWCRYGVQDSTSFAIRIEERYKGLRSPHKLKSAVSGCIRECAEARSKDFGIIATEKGWNLYVGGNGGVNPAHAVLLAEDLDEETVIRYIDRFLMLYIRTADKLTRTSTWLAGLEGGIEYLKKVIIHDSLGINAELEAEMQSLINLYHCEWKEVVTNAERRQAFRSFVNESTGDDSLRFHTVRNQKQPALV